MGVLNGLELMPEGMKIRKIREQELEIDSLKGRLLEAVGEFDTLEQQNADLLAVMTTIQDICQSPNYRTKHTQLQMCNLLDTINNMINQASVDAEGDTK